MFGITLRFFGFSNETSVQRAEKLDFQRGERAHLPALPAVLVEAVRRGLTGLLGRETCLAGINPKTAYGPVWL